MYSAIEYFYITQVKTCYAPLDCNFNTLKPWLSAYIPSHCVCLCSTSCYLHSSTKLNQGNFCFLLDAFVMICWIVCCDLTILMLWDASLLIVDMLLAFISSNLVFWMEWCRWDHQWKLLVGFSGFFGASCVDSCPKLIVS